MPELVHVLDTETRTDRSQHLTFGSARTYLHGTCIDEVLFYADDLPEEELAVLAAYVRNHNRTHGHGQVRLLSRRQYLKHVFWPVTLRARGLVVAFNLPFDLSRLGVGWGTARSSGFAGGFSLILSDYEKDGTRRENRYRPRVVVKSIDSKRALKGFSSCREPETYERVAPDGDEDQPPKRGTFRGHLLDLRTLAFALTNESYSLATACTAFGVEHGKETGVTHGVITPDYIAYNRRDVLATWELFGKLHVEYLRHPIALAMPQAYSPASVGKAYAEAMGIRPLLDRQPDFPREVLGHAMAAYYGGRAECRIRSTPVPVVYLDFLSMYPTVCRLLNLWALLTCERVEVVDATDEVRRLLASATVEDCFRPEIWQQFVGLVQLVPDDDILPVRARYGGEAAWQIGVNRLSSPEPLWYTIPDAVASALLADKPPRVLRAIRLVPHGMSPDLCPVNLRGAIPVDPRTQDFFQVVIEERKRVEQRTDLVLEERTRMSAFLKVLANATSYGIYAQMDRRDLPRGEKTEVVVYGNGNEPFTTRVTAPEEPGPYCFPPIAACIAGAARLMLALLERCVRDAGGAYAMCDTDSMAIVATEDGGLVPCPGGPDRLPVRGRKKQQAIRALSWAEVEAMRKRFTALNPYDREVIPNSILKLEKENIGKDGRQRQLWCYAISAKRYALFTRNVAGRAQTVKYSEHGLGHLLNPMNPDDDAGSWMAALWEGIVAEALGRPYTWPAWIDRTAVGRITASSPDLLRPFGQLNRSTPYAKQVKPFNFLLAAYVAPMGHPLGVDPAHFHLIAPYETDPRKWERIQWTDLYSGRGYRIATESSLYEKDVVRIKTYRDVLTEYRTHPESKSAGISGTICTRSTVGLLWRLHVQPLTITHVGKESNKLEEVQAGLVHDADEVYTEYVNAVHDSWHTVVLPVLKQMPRSLIQQQTGLSRSQITALRNGHAQPRHENRKALTQAAAEFAKAQPHTRGKIGSYDELGLFSVYLQSMRRRVS